MSIDHTGVSFGVVSSVYPRTTPPTAVYWRGALTPPTYSYTNTTPSRAGSYSGYCKGEEREKGGGAIT